jgi:hypothetical protein
MIRPHASTPAQHRAVLLHIARVHLREARARRQQRGFSALLLAWASNARRQATQIDTRPQQMDLFT